MTDTTAILAEREIKLLRAALRRPPAYQSRGTPQERMRLEALAGRCARRRESLAKKEGATR